MSSAQTPLSQNDEKALKALIAWWEDAGIELDEPIVRPKKTEGSAPRPAQPSSRAAFVREKPAEPTRAATAHAATAAGFGKPAPEGPSAQDTVANVKTLEELKQAIENFDGCALKRTARNMVFSRGNPDAKIMIVGEAPGRDEDEQGKPFVGRSGQLLDAMFKAIGLEEEDLYISNIVNWRPPGNRNPTQEEVAICLPLIERHIAIQNPDTLIVTGGVAAQSLLRSTTGITKLRGRWAEYLLKDEQGSETGIKVRTLPMFHPSYLLRRPAEKRHAWSDLLLLKTQQ